MIRTRTKREKCTRCGKEYRTWLINGLCTRCRNKEVPKEEKDKNIYSWNGKLLEKNN